MGIKLVWKHVTGLVPNGRVIRSKAIPTSLGYKQEEVKRDKVRAHKLLYAATCGALSSSLTASPFWTTSSSS